MFNPSTKSRLLRGSTRSTRPCLPESLPDITWTVSPLRILRAMTSEHLRCQGDDLHEVALAKLARDRAEDARAPRVVRVVDQHCGVLVEGDVRPVAAAELPPCAHDHCLYHLTLSHRALRGRALHGADDHVADAGVATLRAAANADAKQLPRTGVVGDFEPCLSLDQCVRLSRLLDDLDEPPPLRARERAALDHADQISLRGLVSLVVDVKRAGRADDPAVDPVPADPVDADRDRLVALVGHHYPLAHLPLAG